MRIRKLDFDVCETWMENWFVIPNVPSGLYVKIFSGLYTSPHMVAVRERIRVNGAPISEEEFARYFFEVWDKLDANDKVRLAYLQRL